MRTLVAIPVFNEQKHVAKVLSEVRRFAKDVLVVDDGSTDDTPILLARQSVEVVRHSRNFGYGRSLRDAFRWASCYGYDWLITMDCDEQHEPESLPAFYQAIERDDADILSGSRYMNAQAAPVADLPPADRRRINAQITEMINQRLGLSLTDSFCGFKAYRVSSLRKFTLTETGYALPLQFWVQAVAAGLRIKEVPVRLIYNDPNRSFGGILDNPDLRLKHYLHVFNQEMTRFPDKFTQPTGVCACGKN